MSARRDPNEKNLGEVIKSLLHEFSLNRKLNEVRLLQHWEKVVGKVITKHTINLNIKNRILFVKLDSPSLKQELMYARSKIKDALNEAVGENVIDEIVFA